MDKKNTAELPVVVYLLVGIWKRAVRLSFTQEQATEFLLDRCFWNPECLPKGFRYTPENLPLLQIKIREALLWGKLLRVGTSTHYHTVMRSKYTTMNPIWAKIFFTSLFKYIHAKGGVGAKEETRGLVLQSRN